jgi:hypothetical protein
MNTTHAARRLVRYCDVRSQIRDGDLLLFRRRGLISVAGRGEHCHAAKAAWWGPDLFLLETRAPLGGRAVTLSSQVKQYAGRIDVYQVNPDGRWAEYDRAGAVRLMRRLAGTHYGYARFITAALLHVPFVRHLLKPEVDDQAVDSRPPFCSYACAMADRIVLQRRIKRSCTQWAVLVQDQLWGAVS